jgi:hypothetical protein
MPDELSKVMHGEQEGDGSEASDEVVPKSELSKKNREAQNLRRERNTLREQVSKLEAERDEAQKNLENGETIKDKRIAELEAELGSVRNARRDEKLAAGLSLDTRRMDVGTVKAVLREHEISPIYGEGDELLNGPELRNFLARAWREKFGYGSSDGGHRSPPPVIEPTMSEKLRSEYRASRGRKR